MSSFTYRSIPPPFARRFSLWGLKNPSTKNCGEGNDSSIFISDTSNMSKWLLVSDSRKFNLFLIEFLFSCPIIFFSLTSFKFTKTFIFFNVFSLWHIYGSPLALAMAPPHCLVTIENDGAYFPTSEQLKIGGLQ